MAIIKSLLDTDLYKFTMQNACIGFNDITEYKFQCRNKEPVNFRKIKNKLYDEINNLCNLRFTKNEISYLKGLGYFSDKYFRRLDGFKLDSKNVEIKFTKNDLNLKIKGMWFDTILFEVPLLAIINELYFKDIKVKDAYLKLKNLYKKIDFIKKIPEFKFADFGTRRRYSSEWQEYVVNIFNIEIPDYLIGTSNVYLAKAYKIKPIGTMAHEWVQAFQGISHPIDSQKAALTVWYDIYKNKLDIALTDTIGIDAFLRDFNLAFTRQYKGVRQDSGDPFKWGEKVLDHYRKNKTDSKTKVAVFSDGLDVYKANKILQKFKNDINVIFGIGTNLTNDVGLKPLNIVIKMVSYNNLPVAKISDSKGKNICEDRHYIKYLKRIFYDRVKM